MCGAVLGYRVAVVNPQTLGLAPTPAPAARCESPPPPPSEPGARGTPPWPFPAPAMHVHPHMPGSACLSVCTCPPTLASYVPSAVPVVIPYPLERHSCLLHLPSQFPTAAPHVPGSPGGQASPWGVSIPSPAGSLRGIRISGATRLPGHPCDRTPAPPDTHRLPAVARGRKMAMVASGGLWTLHPPTSGLWSLRAGSGPISIYTAPTGVDWHARLGAGVPVLYGGHVVAGWPSCCRTHEWPHPAKVQGSTERGNPVI